MQNAHIQKSWIFYKEMLVLLMASLRLKEFFDSYLREGDLNGTIRCAQLKTAAIVLIEQTP